MAQILRTVEDFDAALDRLDDDTVPSTRWEHLWHAAVGDLRDADLAGTVHAHDVLRLRPAFDELWRSIHAPRLGT